MESISTMACTIPLQDVMILAIIMEILAKQHVHEEARIPFMRRNPDHPDVHQTRSRIQLFKDTWPITVEASIIKEDVGWRGKENNFRTLSTSPSYDKGFRVQFQHWSTILLSRYAAISKDWYSSTGTFGDQLIRIQMHKPRSRRSVDEITVHDSDNEYHVITGWEILLTLACHAVRRPLHPTTTS